MCGRLLTTGEDLLLHAGGDPAVESRRAVGGQHAPHSARHGRRCRWGRLHPDLEDIERVGEAGAGDGTEGADGPAGEALPHVQRRHDGCGRVRAWATAI